ncbi:hypothetical protein Mal65_45430 [Crateriforma conspicua]|nr:hypothetical protein Mal65_45430 [Crateriforma conspicua]
MDGRVRQRERLRLRPKELKPIYRGEMMKRSVTHLSLLAAAAVLATGCVPVRHNLPPEQRLMQPGPGVGGPGPGVLAPPMYGATAPAPGPALAASENNAAANLAKIEDSSNGTIAQASYNVGSECGPAGCGPAPGPGLCGIGGTNIPQGGGVMMGGGPVMPMPVPATVQVTFGRPDGMQVRYDASGAGMFDSEPLIVPARQNFPQGGLYRLKLTNIPGREGVELYPTVELAYGNPRTGAYLAHNSIPLQFTDEDFDQVLTGNFVTKVIYLPDPEFQGPALAGIDTLVSTRLDPGIDPIVEADNRGSILAIIRLGDKDIEMAGGSAGGFGGPGVGAPIAGLPAPFAPAMTDGCGCSADGTCAPTAPSLPGMVAGYNAPQYGMPMTGTPIGLPGPPHIPLGAPAGLKKHTIKNHTPMHIPRPVEHLKMNVRQQPGMSYPNPVSRVRITEQNIHPGMPAGRPLHYKASQEVDPNCNQ